MPYLAKHSNARFIFQTLPSDKVGEDGISCASAAIGHAYIKEKMMRQIAAQSLHDVEEMKFQYCNHGRVSLLRIEKKVEITVRK